MPAKPFKRKTVERLKAKHQKNKKSVNEPNKARVKKSKGKKFVKSADTSEKQLSLKSKSKKVVRFSEDPDEIFSLTPKRKKTDELSEESEEDSKDSFSQPKKKKPKKLDSFESVRKQQMLEGIEEEDKIIKKFETLLKLKKRKRKKLPAAFKDDGLDYLLEAVDKKEGEASILSDDDFGLEEDLAAVKGKPLKQNSEIKPTKCPQAKQRTLTELLREKEGIISSAEESNDENFDEEEHCFNDDESDDENFDAEEDFDDENFAGDSDLDSNEDNKTENDKEENSVKHSKKPKVWEDIYGRLRDESGNVIKNSEACKSIYTPPKLRKINTDSEDSKSEVCIKIKRQLKGLLNRLSESNLQNICGQIETMYMKYSRNDMNETLFSLMSELLFTASLTPPRLIMEQAMLIVLLHANIGSEIGAYFLQNIVQKLGTLFKDSNNYGEGKECNNLLIFLSHLYNFKVTHSKLMFDIFHILAESFSSKDIELIQLILKHIGFVLRKDDPLKLKSLIFSIQAKASSFNNDENDSRVKFMLETLTAIRNNNMYKIPDYDPSIIEHSKKFLRGVIRKGCSIQELSISYDDLLKAEERGRWWIVGSAWIDTNDNTSKNSQSVKGNEFSEKIMELARKQHMNTDIRRSIFCTIMTAEDFMDAFERLLKLNLKNQQERQIIHVILHCALNEKSFNPFYTHLLKQFCNFARKHQMCLQFSLWDKFKELSNMKPYQINNLSQLLSHLFASGALPLSVLKVIHFSDMDKPMVRFFRKILLAILLDDKEENCARAFTRIAMSDNLKLLRESLKLFMHHFVLRNQSKLEPEVASKLEARVELAENALNSFKKHIF
ncbi:nucleolar MIF4G domain-containing protein 1 [Trichonephila inaurata madagascariensis]|uniref:Nucleolar MIF4G domain-containing protein 1 n=1 Tax=Trichonephila inaurata madagascariensis TaxID=2747483 RepID=A0A8X6YXR5_9ARAC|nr:nucleolar MIF4G domain-containing protein 1 [Trichonephila inaurata madagascariensis]